MSKVITFASAKLIDQNDMAAFLSPIPNGAQLGDVLANRKPISTRAYDDETRTARYVKSDGIVVTCFTLADVTIDQAEIVAAACEGTPVSNPQEFQDLVELALGPG